MGVDGDEGREDFEEVLVDDSEVDDLGEEDQADVGNIKNHKSTFFLSQKGE